MTASERILITIGGAPLLAMLGSLPMQAIALRAGYYYEEILSRSHVILLMAGIAFFGSLGSLLLQLLFLGFGRDSASRRHGCVASIALASVVFCFPGITDIPQDRLFFLFALTIPVVIASATVIYFPGPVASITDVQ